MRGRTIVGILVMMMSSAALAGEMYGTIAKPGRRSAKAWPLKRSAGRHPIPARPTRGRLPSGRQGEGEVPADGEIQEPVAVARGRFLR
jgi:hypothetical protein